MLNPLPDLLTYHLVAPFIIRIVLAFIFINFGYQTITGEKARWIKIFETIKLQPAKFFEKTFGIIQITGGIMLLGGFYTQIAVLVLSVITFAELFLEYREPAILKNNIFFYLLLLVATLSLLFTGAGFLAFDLPL